MSYPEVETLCSRITLARQTKNLSQAALAEKAGVPQSQISKLDNKSIEDPSFMTLLRIATALELSLDLLAEPDTEKFVKTLVENNLSEDNLSREAEAFRSIREQIDIRKYFTDKLDVKLEPRFPHKFITGNCPFHKDDKESLTVSQSKGTQWDTWECYGECRQKGTVIDALAKAENISFAEAAKELIGLYGLDIDFDFGVEENEVSKTNDKNKPKSFVPDGLQADSNILKSGDPHSAAKGIVPIGNPGSSRDDRSGYIGIDNKNLNQHMLAVGKTGSGKTEFMKWACYGIARDDYPLVVVDTHGSLADDLLNSLIRFYPERAEDIVFCDFTRTDSVSINPLDVKKQEGVTPAVQATMEMLGAPANARLVWAPRAVLYTRFALIALCEANLQIKDPHKKHTLVDMVAFFTDNAFRQKIVSMGTNTEVKNLFDFYEGQFEQLPERLKAEQSSPILKTFTNLSESVFDDTFSNSANNLNLAELVLENKIVILKLGGIGMMNSIKGSMIASYLIGSLTYTLNEWGNKLPKDSAGTKGVRIVIDDAGSILQDSEIIQLLAEARRWDLGFILAAQFLDQFDPRVIKAVLANTATKLVFSTDPTTVSSLEKSLTGRNTNIKSEDLTDQPNFHFIGRALIDDGGHLKTSEPFSAFCLPMLEGGLNREQKDMRDKIIEDSRRRLSNEDV